MFLPLYASVGALQDKRIFLALISPFVIYMDSSLLKWPILGCIVVLWFIVLGLQIYF